MEGRKLRCKPGDLVVVVGGLYEELIGKIFRVTTRCKVFPNSWETDPPQFLAPYRKPVSFDDVTLRPIRPDESHESIETGGEPVEVVEVVA